MTARKKTKALVPGVTGATTRAARKGVARAHHGQLVRSLRPSLKHLIVPLDAELPRGPHQRLQTRRRIISKAHAIIDDQFQAIGLELPALVQATRGIPRKLIQCGRVYIQSPADPVTDNDLDSIRRRS
jgi:hypothetical protein